LQLALYAGIRLTSKGLRQYLNRDEGIHWLARKEGADNYALFLF